MNKCIGCGSILKDNENKLCQRCFRLIHYGEYKESNTYSKEEILKYLNINKEFTFFLTDLLNLNKEVINTYKEIKTNKCLVISKCDYLDKYIKFNKLKDNIKNIYNIEEEIIFISSKKNYLNDFRRILKGINKCYIVGFTNAGKSTLINSILESDRVTSSYFYNTTIDYISINYEDKNIIDTPGFNYQEYIYDKNDYKLIKRLTPSKYLKQITYKLDNNSSLIIEDFLRIDSDTSCTLNIYISNLINIEKVYNNKLSNKNKYIYKLEKNQELVIKGIMFLRSNKDTNITLYMDKNIGEVRNRIVGD